MQQMIHKLNMSLQIANKITPDCRWG
uniref:Uncharacterized protein n=1 Tax=Arundo donax TaxID=35708 RepID=A0A0A8Z3E0_ARUDO